MNFVSLISAATAPGGLWTILINWIQGGIGNFGWTILLLTILVKLVISPLDFAVKLSNKKQMLVQQKCAPQVDKIKKKFGKDQNSVRIQTQSLYKREGLKTGVGCIVMLVNLVLTMVIFFTFYASLRKNSAYQVVNEYEVLQTTYTSSYYNSLAGYYEDDNIETADDAYTFTNNYYTNYKVTYDNGYAAYSVSKEYVETHKDDEDVETDETYLANLAVVNNFETATAIVEKYDKAVKDSIIQAENDTLAKWKETKATWLWVDNIWVADSTTSPFPTYKGLVDTAGNGGYSTYVAENIDEGSYTVIAELINNHGGRTKNGYYILAILAAAVTFLSQFITELHTKLKNKKANIVAKSATDSSMGFSMKLMKIIMPIIMLVFVLTTSASFGIYILASNVASIAFGEIVALIVNALTKKKQAEVEEFLEKEANRMIKKGKLQEK